MSTNKLFTNTKSILLSLLEIPKWIFTIVVLILFTIAFTVLLLHMWLSGIIKKYVRR